MGNIFSSEEKLQRDKFLAGRNPRKIVGVYEQYGYDRTDASAGGEKERRYIKKRNLSFNDRNGRYYYYKSKSHSLNAILEELYSFGPEKDAREEITHFGGTLIPRIPLKGYKRGLREENNCKALRKMSSESEIFFADNNNLRGRLNHGVSVDVPQNTAEVIMNGSEFEMSKKSDDNYFAKNFDDCMKRLEVIEKEFDLMEKSDADNRFSRLGGDSEDGNSPTEMPENYDSESENCDEGPAEDKICENNQPKCKNQRENFANGEEVKVWTKQNSAPTETVKTEPAEDVVSLQQNKESISRWYSNLKQQFEIKERECQEVKAREISCRITSATLKTTQEKQKSEDKQKDTRHYFSSLVKTNRSLIDEELPDPDKVKHIRAMFQETLDSALKGKLDKKLGGSLQNISFRAADQHVDRPLSAQCCRDEMLGDTANSRPPGDRKDVESSARQLPKPSRAEGHKDFEIENTKKKLFEKYEKELKPVRDYKSRRVLQTKWTDTGSVSSGVSSDLSSYDTDLESYSREGTEQDEMTISDDDLLEEVKDKHYIQNEVLEKIRSYGTSVTYYGGEMLTCSVGPLFSPTTQAILEEIGEKYGNDPSPTRSFDEFYRKYVDANEPGRKIKVGRTRSFGHNDVFQKPNVLSNTEIDLYKTDLEIEIGIKKPAGIPQNTLKRKVTKSASLGNEKAVEKSTEISPQAIIPTAESEVLGDSAAEKFSKENEIAKENASENITPVANSEGEINEKPENNSKKDEEKLEKPIKEEEKETPKTASEKEYVRSKSAPEGLPTPKKFEITPVNSESPAKDIYFSYEKSIFNGNRKSDMEFEEFEVCESVSEKLEKLDKQSPESSTVASPEVEPQTRLNDRLEEPPAKEPDESLHGVTSAEETEKPETEVRSLASVGNNASGKTRAKFNPSRWPIETTVMVDIQKEDEQTPKIITNRKTVAKAKVRLF